MSAGMVLRLAYTMMTRADFRFLHRLRVRWAEVDAQGIVFNGHYLTYVDVASTEYWRALAMPYPEAFHAVQGDLFVKKSQLEYHGSARFDDILDVGLRCGRLGVSSMRFDWSIFRQWEPLVSGEIIYVLADVDTQRPTPIPEDLRNTFTAFEAGETMVRVRVGSWQDLGTAAMSLRTAVFVGEQGLPPEVEQDAQDGDAIHAVAYNRYDWPMATGRLLVQAPREGRIGRMAVRPSMRGAGTGRRVLDALLQAAAGRGDREVVLHAQSTAVPFFERAGFVAHGPEFEEACRPHRKMVKVL